MWDDNFSGAEFQATKGYDNCWICAALLIDMFINECAYSFMRLILARDTINI